MKLLRLLRLQTVYWIVAVGYNVVSWLRVRAGRPPLSATTPKTGLLVMSLYGSWLIPGRAGIMPLYRMLMGVAVAYLGYGGILRHIRNRFDNPRLYSSTLAWAAAIGINSFGLILNLLAAAGQFEAPASSPPPAAPISEPAEA